MAAAERTAAEQHRMARQSAHYTVRHRPDGATLGDVMREQGLAEIRAKRALEELLRDGKVKKVGKRYLSVG